MKYIFAFALCGTFVGCMSQADRTASTERQQQHMRDALMAATTPESDPLLFADAIPRPFRVAALQSCEFRRRYTRWPKDSVELEHEFGKSESQSYHVAVGLDGGLVLSWQTDSGPGEAVLKISKEYIVSFSLIPAIDATAAVRSREQTETRRADALEQGISNAMRAR